MQETKNILSMINDDMLGELKVDELPERLEMSLITEMGDIAGFDTCKPVTCDLDCHPVE